MKFIHRFLLLATLAYSIWLLQPLTQPGIPRFGDGEYFLARQANYYLALRQGQLPPRWAPNLNFGLGYPILNFHYPLPNLLGSFFLHLGLSVVASFKILMVLLFVLALLGMYFFLNFSVSRPTSLLGALVYVASPYYLIDFYTRGSIGELCAFAFLPWALLAYHRLNQSPSHLHLIFFAFTLALLLLSHNLAALMSLIFLGLIFYLHLPSNWRLIAFSTVIAVFLVSFFWIPALAELRFTQAAASPLNQLKLSQAIPLTQLLNPFDPSARKLPGPNLSLPLAPGFASLFSLAVAIYLLSRSHDKPLGVITTVTIIILFFVTPQGVSVLRLLPGSGFLQHPWRLLWLTTILTSILTAKVLHQINHFWLHAIFLSVLLFSLSSVTLPDQFIPYEDPFFFSYPLTSTTAREFDPPWYKPDQAVAFIQSQSTQNIISSPSAALISINHLDGTQKHYQVTVSQPTQIVEKTLYFPGWVTTIDNQSVNLDQTKFNFFGLINYHLDPGTYIITTRFTQQTPSRIIGNSLSLLGLFLLGLVATTKLPQSIL